jgi:hypothetical protein
LKVTDEKKQDPNPHPDQLVRGMDPRIWIRIWICTKISCIRNTACIYSYIFLIPPLVCIGTKLGDAGGDLHTEPEAARGQGGAPPGVQPRPLSSSPHRRPPDRGRGRLPSLLGSHGRHQERQGLRHQGGKGNKVVIFNPRGCVARKLLWFSN